MANIPSTLALIFLPFHQSMSVTDEDSLPTTPPTDRLAWRDTHIYASDSRDTMLGGLWASEGITNANLYSMLEIICFFTDTFHLYDDRK